MVDFTADCDRTRTSEQVSADDADLQAGIGDLAGLVAGSLGLPELLAEVAAFAVRAIPGADGAGVTLLRVDRAIKNMDATRHSELVDAIDSGDADTAETAVRDHMAAAANVLVEGAA